MTTTDWHKIPPIDRKRVRRALSKMRDKFDVIERSIFDSMPHRFNTPNGDIISEGLYVEYDLNNALCPNATKATDLFVDTIDLIESGIRDIFFVEQKSDLIGRTFAWDSSEIVNAFVKSAAPGYTGHRIIVGSPKNFANEPVVSVGRRFVLEPGMMPEVVFRIKFNDGQFYLVFHDVDPEFMFTLNVECPKH